MLVVSHGAPENMDFAQNWQEQGSCAHGAGTAWMWEPSGFYTQPHCSPAPSWENRNNLHCPSQLNHPLRPLTPAYPCVSVTAAGCREELWLWEVTFWDTATAKPGCSSTCQEKTPTLCVMHRDPKLRSLWHRKNKPVRWKTGRRDGQKWTAGEIKYSKCRGQRLHTFKGSQWLQINLHLK